MPPMKFVVFGPDRRVGIIHDDALVVDVSLACAKLLHERDGEPRATELAAVLAPPDLARYIERGEAALDVARDSLAHLFERAGDRAGPRGETIVHDLSSVRLHAPRPAAARIACAGGNFADHHLAMAQRRPAAGRFGHFPPLDKAAARRRSRRAAGADAMRYLPAAMKPAFFISETWRASSFATQSA